MADQDLSLLFRLKGDATGIRAASAEARASVNQLKQSFGPELTSTVTVANRAFGDLAQNLNLFVGQRIPLVGGAFVRVTENLRNLGNESKVSEKAISAVANSIASIAKESGKSIPQIGQFLTRFVQIEGQAKRDAAAVEFFGASLASRLIPQLETAGTELGVLASESAAAGASIATVAGPVAAVAIALAAQVAAVVTLTHAIFDLTKASAEYQGKLFDLSQQTGVSVETLSALEVVARTTGSSIEQLTQSLGIFQRKLEEAVEDPTSKAAKRFRELKVEAADTESALRQTVAALARMPAGFQQTAAALEVFGRGGKAFLAIAKEANGDIDEITRRLGRLGLVTTEQARLADEFNDQLVLLQVSLRGLGTQAIPVVLDVLRDLSRTLNDNRIVFNVLQGIVKAVALSISVPLSGALRTARDQLELLRIILIPVVASLEKMKEAIEFISGHPLPGFTPAAPVDTQLPPQVPQPTKDPFTRNLEDEIAARKRLQGVLNFAFAERQQQALASIALAQREFEAGRRTREELLESTIAGRKRQTQAEIDALNVERKIKLAEQALAKDDVEKQTQLSNAILSIDTQVAGKRAEIRRAEADERAKFQQEQIVAEAAHQERLLAASKQLDQVRITGIEQQVALQKKAALDGDKEIEAIELTAIDREQSLLVRRLDLAGRDLAKRKEIQDRVAALDTERTAVEQRHSQQRIDIVTREGDVVLQRIQAVGESIIVTAQALAQARVITEEEAERRIAKVRLDALDAEIELARARGQDVRVLTEQRRILAAQTEHDITTGQQRDLQNQRNYADDLRDIQGRIGDVQRDIAEEVLRAMVRNFASRRDIIRAQTQLDLDDENARHERANTNLERLRQENAASNRTQAEKLEFEAELNRLREAEAERHRQVMQGIHDQGRKDEDAASPLGQFDLSTDQLKEFASVIEGTIVPLGEILKRTFLDVANAIGQTVANYVLLGTTGPAVMRKILATALATIAAEAAVNAIKELALGFASLFFNPAEAAAHFTAAALWGSIAGVTAVAGRAVAGNLFQQGSGASGGAGSRSGNGTSDRSGVTNPIDLTRQQQREELHIFVHAEPGPQFDRAVVMASIDDIRLNGPLRETVVETVGA